MRIKEIMERVENPVYDPEAGFLQNVGRASLNRFTQSELGIDAYDRETQRREQEPVARVRPAVEPQATPAVDTPTVDPGTEPEIYYFDDRELDPQNPNDAKIIKQLQAAGVTSARAGIPKTK
jgi:hypothetical protein